MAIKTEQLAKKFAFAMSTTETDKPFRSINSLGLAELLETTGISLLVSTYQAGKLMAVRGSQGKIQILLVRGYSVRIAAICSRS